MNVILKVEKLSKQYRLGVVGTGALTHDLNRFWHRIRGKEDPYLKIGEVNDRASKANSKYVWALQDINFELQQGEVLGIIGKNGAGKSTLLKILSRVTSPTTGSIKTKGRIASLLEVGTGFHPELTGRENIFLNGAILGMKKAEINAKLDEIISFSGCEKYVDTPVKRYSSGMRVRLAFAVAAHLEPDILVIDEVLAVGDVEFQKKAIGKMQDISKGEGRTVLFVSHNMASIQQLCERVIILSNGIVAYDTKNVDEGINYYLQNERMNISEKLGDRADRKGDGSLRVIEVLVKNNKGDILDTLLTGASVNFVFNCTKKQVALKNISIAFSVSKRNGTLLSTIVSDVAGAQLSASKNETLFTATCAIAKLPFTEGDYICNVFVKSEQGIADWVENAFSFSVIDGDFYGTGKTIPKSHPGVLVNNTWKVLLD